MNRAFFSGDSIILLGNFNAKLGKLIIPGDIHGMSPNGKFLNDIIENRSLKVLNTHKNSKGILTRVQKNLGRVERSVLDYVFVTHDLYEMLISTYVDESKSVTPYRKLKISCRSSDHNAILFTFEVNSQNALGSFKDSRQTVRNFADVSGWDSFRNLTDSNKGYVDIYKNVVDINENYIRWERKLNSTLHKCFKRKRVRKTSFLYNESIRSLIKERKTLKREVSMCKDKHTSSDFEKKIIYLDKKIDKKIARFNSNILKAGMNKFGVIDKQSFWKIRQKLAPKSVSFPHAVYDKWGTEITDPDDVKQEYKHEFMYRLRNREMSTELKQYEVAEEKVCQDKLLKCQSEVTPDFILGEVRSVVNEFKAGKSIDPTGVAREVFMNAGDEFLRYLTCMANVFKKQRKFPHE